MVGAPSIGSTRADKRTVAVVGAAEGSAALTLDECGMICDCDSVGEALFDYHRNEMVWQHVSMLLPELTEQRLMRNGEIAPRLRFLSRIGHPFAAVTCSGGSFACELFFNVLDGTGHGRVSLIVRAVGKQAG